MPGTTYNKSLASDFNNVLDQYQLREDITNSAIVPTLLEITLTDDDVDIKFASALSGEEQTLLNTLISNHTPTPPPKANFFKYTPTKKEVSNTAYQRVGGGFKYAGSDTIGLINYIEIISEKDTTISSYSVRVYDFTNNQIIAESTNLTNSEEAVIDLGTVSNIPTTEAIFEVHAKANDGPYTATICIEEVTIYYNN